MPYAESNLSNPSSRRSLSNSSAARALARWAATCAARWDARELEQVAPSNDRAAIEAALADAAEGIEYLRAASQPQAASRGAAIRLNFGDIADPASRRRPPAHRRRDARSARNLELTRLLDLAAEARVDSARRRRTISAPGRARRRDRRSARAGARAARQRFCPTARWPTTPASRWAACAATSKSSASAIQQSLERFLRAHHEDGTLQEDFVTIRNDRFVVPVVTGRERRVDGVIHGASGSGHTLFVEPLETIELNNELVRLPEEEAREVHRILREFTARLREHAAADRVHHQARWPAGADVRQGRVRAGFSTASSRASARRNTRRLILREARHPLLEDILRKQQKAVVPVSFDLDDAAAHAADQRTEHRRQDGRAENRRTAGADGARRLARARAEAEFPLFDEVLADIGDHQSIQESLSTFSAHIVSIRVDAGTRHAGFAGADRRTWPRDRSRRRRRAGRGRAGAFRARGAFTAGLHASDGAKVYGASTAGVRTAPWVSTRPRSSRLMFCAWARRASPPASTSRAAWASTRR